MGKPQRIQPEVTSNIPEAFMPFAQSLITYLTGRSQEQYPNPYQQSLLGGFFGQQPQARTQQPGIGLPPGLPGQPGLPPGGAPSAPFERDFQGGDLRSQPFMEGRPLFGPTGTDPTFGGSRANTAVMNFMSRLFPGYAGRAQIAAFGQQGETARLAGLRQLGGQAGFGPQLMSDLQAGAGWGNLPGGVRELADIRTESAARSARMDALLDELDPSRREAEIKAQGYYGR